MSAILYGLGVGPGDPELITVKALRILQGAPVIAYPAPQEGDSLVRRIVSPHIDRADPPIEVVMRMPMLADRFPAQEVYDRAEAELAGHLDAGRDVAVLCEGDPFFYGSFMYLFGRMAKRHRVEVVPGVSSLTACAAMAGAPLASRNDVLAVVPAPLPEAELAKRLAGVEAAAIIKVGRHLEKVHRVLSDLGLVDRARYIEHATMESQKILTLDAVADEAAPYFSMILVHRRGEAWS
jgi:precorrin-2/cobalt-factor-2 C20-methyltransferase